MFLDFSGGVGGPIFIYSKRLNEDVSYENDKNI
jgi:hypothetical protein